MHGVAERARPHHADLLAAGGADHEGACEIAVRAELHQLAHHGAAGAVIHRAPAEKVGVGHFGDGVCEDGAVALPDPQRPALTGRGTGHVDVEVLRAAHGAGLLGGHEVAGLRADHAGDPIPADPHLASDHQVFGHAAELVEGEKAVLVDVFDAEADLIRVGGDQDGGAGAATPFDGGEVAQRADLHLVGIGLEAGGHRPDDVLLLARHADDRGEIAKHFFHFLFDSGAFHRPFSFSKQTDFW